MTVYQLVTIALGTIGFMVTWTVMWFGAGRGVEKSKASFKKDIELERDKIVDLVRQIQDKFEDDQKTQDHRYGEVSSALRQYIADIEKQFREAEIWGRDNYVQKPEFRSAIDTMRADLKEISRSIKEDFKVVFEKIDAARNVRD